MTRRASRIPTSCCTSRPTTRRQILITGENFGCGSSREHAPWALLDFGIRCIIAPSFADIFYNNCFKNGILPIALPQSEIDKLLDDASRGPNATITIDLPNQEIRGPDGGVIRFRHRSVSQALPRWKASTISVSRWRRPSISTASRQSTVPAAPGLRRRVGKGTLRRAHRWDPAWATAGPLYSNTIGFELCSTSVLPSRVIVTFA